MIFAVLSQKKLDEKFKKIKLFLSEFRNVKNAVVRNNIECVINNNINKIVLI